MSSDSKNSRRKARQRAFQILYGLTFHKSEPDLVFAFRQNPASYDEAAGAAETEGYAWKLLQNVWRRREELDEVITRFSQHWRIQRIARVELTILRLAIYEMLHEPDVPLRVAINEAIELSKRFGDDNSRNFVNGILDAAARAVDKGEFGIHKGI
jgi:N utilization substance protein B